MLNCAKGLGLLNKGAVRTVDKKCPQTTSPFEPLVQILHNFT